MCQRLSRIIITRFGIFRPGIYGRVPRGAALPKKTFDHRYETLLGLLLQARHARKLTQTDLAERLKKPQSFVSKYERGERRLDVVEFLDVAIALEADWPSLLGKVSRS